MKKTMLALMATVGLAFCAKAEVLNSTGFEDYGKNGFAVPGDDNGATVGNQYWQPGIADTTDFESTILKVYENVGEKPGTLPKNFESAGSKYLSVDTGSNVLLRKAASDPTCSCNLNDDPVFLDTNVKFTATEDNTVTPEAGDKLIVWLYAEEGTTNLMITAAEALNKVGAPTAPTNFVANVTVSPDTWYRLTVKAAIDGNSHTYFNVYLDGAPVAEVGGQKDFYSLVDSAAGGGQEITAVGFKGTGALDNVVWTTEDPFPAPVVDDVALTISVTGEGEMLAGLTEQVGGGAASEVNVENPENIVATVDDVITFVAKVADGFTPTVAGYVLQKSAEKDEDDCYAYTFTATVTQAMIDDGLALAINVAEDGGEEATDISTAVVVLSADSIKVGEACPTVTSVTVSEVPLALGTDYTVAYPDVSTEGEKTITLTGTGKYTGTATATFTVTAAEPTTVVTPTAAEIASGEIPVTGETTAIKIGTIEVPIEAFDVNAGVATVKAPVVSESAEAAGDAFVIDDDNDEVTINVNPVEGLFYGVSAATDLDALERPAALTQFDGTNAAEIFTVSKPEGTAAFFKVYSDVKE